MSTTLERLPFPNRPRDTRHRESCRHRHARRSSPRHDSPWVIDTRALGRRPGTMRTLRIAVPLDEPMGLEMLAVPPGAEVDLDLRLESVAEGVLVSGTAAATAAGSAPAA